jgi:hypothetical protein
MNDQGKQAWYDIYAAVDPGDTTGNTLYVGLTDIYKTTNALATTPTWTNITKVYSCSVSPCPAIHPDQHSALFVPKTGGGFTDYFGNDGGVFQSADGGATFASDNATLTLSQFYAGSLSPQNASLVTGGLQDNGTAETKGTSAWRFVFGGDGFFTATDPTNNQTQYEEYVYGNINRTTDDWTTTTDISDPSWSQAGGDPSNFSTPFVLDPNSKTTIYMGRSHLWKTANSTATTPTWTNISPSLSTSNITAIAPAKSSAGTIYIGDSSAEDWVTTTGGTTWTPLFSVGLCDPAHPVPFQCVPLLTGITGMVVDPTNSQTIYVTAGGFDGAQQYHVFKSTDGGTSWTDISTSLPDIPFQSIAINPTMPSTIYAGSDLGVYVSTDAGATWSALGTALPNASVYSLVPSSDGMSLIAFTHGRGAWKISTDLSPPRNSRLTATPTSGQPTSTPTPVASRNSRMTPTPVVVGATATPTAVGGRHGRP